MVLPLLMLAAAGVAVCPAGFEDLEGACVAQRAQPAPVVVYFHGMFPGTTDWARVREFRLLGAEAKKRGFTLVALRGEQGLCSWAKDVEQHWCWPSDLSQLKDVGRILERVGRVLAKVRGVGAPVFAGFSNGGYFTSIIASDTKAEARGFAVLGAGNVNGETFPPERAAPFLVVGATRDTIQLPVAKRLHALLTEAGWPVQLKVREGVHEITAEDAKLLFDFASSLGEVTQPPSAEPPSGKPPSGSDTGAGVNGGGSKSPVR